MRGTAASALKGYNKGQDLHRMNPARILGDVTDVRFGNYGLCHIQSSQLSEGRVESEEQQMVQMQQSEAGSPAV